MKKAKTYIHRASDTQVQSLYKKIIQIVKTASFYNFCYGETRMIFEFNRHYIHVRLVTKPHIFIQSFAALLISNFEISIVKEEEQNVQERLL